MSPALSDLPVRKITRFIDSLGFIYARTKGSHAVYRHPDRDHPPTRHCQAWNTQFNPAAGSITTGEFRELLAERSGLVADWLVYPCPESVA